MELTQNQLEIRVNLKSRRFNYTIYKVTKRVLDIAVSGLALLILLPLLATVALIIKLTSKGPVIFTQQRAGLEGKTINFIKFRSMVQDADQLLEELQKQNDHKDSITFKMKRDPRITLIGRIIRKQSIDELPQLWLVLKGDMTLVGPRPATVSEVDKYNLQAMQRLMVKPGLTCIWQVSGRGDIPFKEQLAMDIYYINNRSTWMDLKLLVLTVPAVISGKGAY